MTNSRNIGLLLVVMALVAVIAGCTSNTAAPAQTSAPSTQAPSSSAPSGSTAQQKIKLSDTGYWNYAHLISGGTLDSSAQAAIAGFSVEKSVMPDGNTKILLKATDPKYNSQTYVLTPGEQLYFIETSMGDDSKTQEFNLGDDNAVVVDAQGYVVQ